MTRFSAEGALGCTHPCLYNDPSLDPHRMEHMVLLVLLVVGYVLWKWIEPPARPRLRTAGVLAGLSAVFASCAQTCVPMQHDIDVVSLWLVESIAVMTAVLYLELALSLRRPRLVPEARVVTLRR